MKIYNLLITKFKDQRGVSAVVVAIAITILIGFVALAVDIGYVAVTKNELQNVADASALAATGQLGAIYQPMTSDQIEGHVLVSGEIDNIINSVIDPSTGVAKKNKAAAKFVEVLASDIEIGRWKDPDLDPNGFSATLTQPDAVRVTTRRDDTVSTGKVGMFFAKIFGFDSVPVKAQATAALTSLGNVGPGGIPIPVGIPKYWFNPLNWPPGGFCDQNIKFAPTGTLEGCAGWHVFKKYPWNIPHMRTIIDGMAADPPTYESPEIIAGKTKLNFGGGLAATLFSNFEDLYNAHKDPDTNEWETTVVVYDWDNCDNPNPGGGNDKGILIVGFATAIITNVYDSPVHTIEAKVICEDVEWGRGGGGKYGTSGTIPGLVQ